MVVSGGRRRPAGTVPDVAHGPWRYPRGWSLAFRSTRRSRLLRRHSVPPGRAIGLFWRRVTMSAVFTGLIPGIAILTLLVPTRKDPFIGINAGFVALCANFAVTGVLSLLSASPGVVTESVAATR